MKILVISDIHASASDASAANAPSYVSSESSKGGPTADPFDNLVQLISALSIKPDLLLCAGDMTNRSAPAPFTYVWGKIVGTASKLDATVISTVGNHDLDSRLLANKNDPKGFAMGLKPLIPFDNRQNYLEFWAEHFTHIDTDDANIIVLNTAAYHGYGEGEKLKAELEHGRITDHTLEKIRAKLLNIPKRPINLLLCHHHPQKAEPNDVNSEGVTSGGDKLVQLLNDDIHNEWVIIHGHKHRPDVFYGNGGADATVIIGSASFSAQVNLDSQNKNPNQFHLIEFEDVGDGSIWAPPKGKITSWTWVPGDGWRPSVGRSHGLPHVTGFGCRIGGQALAQTVIRHMNNPKLELLKWPQVKTLVPDVSHLIPDDFKKFASTLNSNGFQLQYDEYGTANAIGRSE